MDGVGHLFGLAGAELSLGAADNQRTKKRAVGGAGFGGSASSLKAQISAPDLGVAGGGPLNLLQEMDRLSVLHFEPHIRVIFLVRCLQQLWSDCGVVFRAGRIPRREREEARLPSHKDRGCQAQPITLLRREAGPRRTSR